MGQKIPNRIHDLNAFIAAFDAHVNVQAKNQVRAGHIAQFIDKPVVAFVGRDQLVLPVGKRVSSGSRNLQVLLFGQFNNHLAEVGHFLAGILNIMADIRTYFNDSLVHFGLHPFVKNNLATINNFRHV